MRNEHVGMLCSGFTHSWWAALLHTISPRMVVDATCVSEEHVIVHQILLWCLRISKNCSGLSNLTTLRQPPRAVHVLSVAKASVCPAPHPGWQGKASAQGDSSSRAKSGKTVSSYTDKQLEVLQGKNGSAFQPARESASKLRFLQPSLGLPGSMGRKSSETLSQPSPSSTPRLGTSTTEPHAAMVLRSMSVRFLVKPRRGSRTTNDEAEHAPEAALLYTQSPRQ